MSLWNEFTSQHWITSGCISVGPVKNPYVSVNIFRSVNRRDLESRHGEKLFVSTKSEMEKLNKKNKNSKSRKGSKGNSKNSKKL